MAVKKVSFLKGATGLIKGLFITGKYMVSKPFTVLYPFEKREISERWRGPLYLKGMMYEYEPEEGKETIAPCKGACPANVDPRLQNRLVVEGKPEDAYLVVRDRNILPGVLGRICNHPCETKCRRGGYDQPIAIRNLHRYIQEKFFENPVKLEKFEERYKEKIAVVGSGPAGLAAAYSLAKKGYRVKVFDRHPYPGGMLMIGVPKYRLPREEILKEIELLEKQGIEFQTNIEIGKDINLNDLAKEYDAVIIAVGLQKSRSLNIPGIGLPGVNFAIPFLKQANIEEKADIGKEVVVVGGGNVAVDVARTALRVGAKVVKMVCLEKREEMPAFSWEIEEAIEEGVRLYPGWGPKRVVGENKVEGLEVIQCLSVFDDEGRFNPTFDENNVKVIKGDTVIFAIGQYGDMSFADGSDVEIDDRGRLVIDPETWQTTVKNIFACGEIITGPSTAISSMGTGHEVAEKVHRYLRGQDPRGESIIYKGNDPSPVNPPISIIHEAERLRLELRKRKPMERVKDFAGIEFGYSEEEAKREAGRCLQCDTQACVGCAFCARACPDFCISVEREESNGERKITRWDYDIEKCSFCGLCVDACPTKTLKMSYDEIELAEEVRPKTYSKSEMLRKVRY
ncbi:MAG: FAD-dependent oxidoreductase [Actinobacteria bacterium]|nr:FAD-dependent oxidoreductase [Actinomycetota bacterium]